MICANRFPNLTLLFWEQCSMLVGSFSSANAGSNVSSKWGFVIACLTAAHAWWLPACGTWQEQACCAACRESQGSAGCSLGEGSP